MFEKVSPQRLKRDLDKAAKKAVFDHEKGELVATRATKYVEQGEVIWDETGFRCPALARLESLSCSVEFLDDIAARFQKPPQWSNHRRYTIFDDRELGTKNAFSKHLRRKLWKLTIRKAELKRLNKNRGLWAVRDHILTASTAPRMTAPTPQVPKSRRGEMS